MSLNWHYIYIISFIYLWNSVETNNSNIRIFEYLRPNSAIRIRIRVIYNSVKVFGIRIFGNHYSNSQYSNIFEYISNIVSNCVLCARKDFLASCLTLTGGCSKGSSRLTCTAQPGHGGKRRDSSEERVSSAIIEFMHEIDHKPNNLNETQYFDIKFGTLEWLGAAMKCLAMDV